MSSVTTAAATGARPGHSAANRGPVRPRDRSRPASIGVAIRRTLAFVAIVTASASPSACHPKASAAECDLLLDRYAGLVVEHKYPDASAGDLAAERQREKSEARGDDAFKNCSSEVSRSEFECAMHADSPDGFEKCLE